MRGQIRLMMTVRSFKNMVMRRNNNTETQRQRLLRHETVMRAITQVLANIQGEDEMRCNDYTFASSIIPLSFSLLISFTILNLSFPYFTFF